MIRRGTDNLINAAGFPTKAGLYDPAFEHDSCGIGFVARLDGEPRHSVIESGMHILKNLAHRGAVGGDKATGDGCGMMVLTPDLFFREYFNAKGVTLPNPGDYAVGSVFLPTDTKLAQKCRQIFEKYANQEGCEPIGWRQTPTNPAALGELGRSCMPQIEQFIVARGAVDRSDFDRKLYVVRRQTEKEIWKRKEDTSQFYVPSLSSKTLIYKGLLIGSRLLDFFLDLNDDSFASPLALIHQRYSTNTFPAWPLAQPFRFLAHNGEINTLRGNINQMRAREKILHSDLFGEDIEKIKPIIVEGASDSATLDNALELLVSAGRSLPHAIMMLVPEAWGPRFQMSEDKRAFYEFHATLMEPWDGPASLVFCDGRYIGGTLDRNGLRPSRWTITKDGTITMASETGVLDSPADQVIRNGRLRPGKMFLLDLQQNRIVPDAEIKSKISRARPYRQWLKENRIELRGLLTPSRVPSLEGKLLRTLQHVFGYTDEELKMIIKPMATRGQEPVGSMGNDAALAVLSERPQLLFNYFKQLFAQVTNPAIDPLREGLVMSLMSFVGTESNILEETPEHCRRLKLQHFLLSPRDMVRLENTAHAKIVIRRIDILAPAGSDGNAMEKALKAVFAKARKAVEEGATMLVLTDRGVDKDHLPIPSLLATAGLHHFLIREGMRNSVGLILETGEVREVMHFALLLGYGANAICPYLALATVRHMYDEGILDGPQTSNEATDLYTNAIKKGILKTLSRMGISTIRSYCGAQIFEAVGLGQKLIDRYFTNTPSRIGGIGLAEVAEEAAARHLKAFPANDLPAPLLLEPGGNYHIRQGGETHHWSPEMIYKLQQASQTNDYDVFKQYTRLVDDQSRRRSTLRSLFKFKETSAIDLEEVEPVAKILPRFVTAAMSLGSISQEAHESIAIALNRLGGRSNSGEGGEDPQRYIPLPNGDSKRSKIKQIASGRFGVTTDYLIHADELQIKVAQGAKPGEGGQLPGHKVSKYIAQIRHTTPGVTLISPPPHHDIYSIEDLAQLIYDLKSVNPRANVSVKLVSEVGVGTVAAGVSKAKADLVLISGYDGGTGASPLTSIKHAGIPWELGLAETQQTLVRSNLRDRIRVQVDGQLKSGRDLAIAALLGAEEFGFGTSILVTQGCVMMRKCHLNTCPVGVATQDPVLRKKFAGKPEYVECFLKFIAQELREYMARLGFRTIDEMVGRVDLLELETDVMQKKAAKLDLSPLLYFNDKEPKSPLCCTRKQEHDLEDSLDKELLRLAEPALDRGDPVTIALPIRNIHRTVCSTLSGEIVRRYGPQGLAAETVKIHFTGSAGQSLGAFLAPGITIRLEGDANDYLGKGMSGGRIVLTPPVGAGFVAHENIIVGNVVLYGATAGEIYIHGVAGERFAVRNSGAKAVVEGVGDHCCEYMTGGVVVVLGGSGYNFAAGMSGGVAYVYDESELFDTRCNLDMVDLETVWRKADITELHGLIKKHFRLTGSQRAKMLLDNWEAHLPLFVKVMPIDYRKALARMHLEEDPEGESVAATEEVYGG